MRVCVTGDVVGPQGVELACARIAALRRDGVADVVLVNGDNTDVSGPSPFHGSGLGVEARDALLAAGADLVLTGSHAFDLPESLEHPRVLRAGNLPQVRGQGHATVAAGGRRLDVVQLAVRGSSPTAYPPLPWLRSQRLGGPPLIHFVCDAPFVTTLFAHAVDGSAAGVVGSMNHVPSLRAERLPRGTALVWDVGFVGPSGGVGGFDVEPFLVAIDTPAGQRSLGVDLERFVTAAEERWTQQRGGYRFSDGAPVFDAVLIDVGEDGLARSVTRL